MASSSSSSKPRQALPLELVRAMRSIASRAYGFTATKYQPIKPLSSGHFTTDSRLLRLPGELLTIVLEHVPYASLQEFALASRTCCMLARTRLCAEVVLDYSPRSWALLEALFYEAQEQQSSDEATTVPSIGTYIRKLTVVSAKTEPWHHFAAVHYNVQYKSLAFILTSSLPRLAALIWKDGAVIPAELWQSIVKTPIRHLTLATPLIDEHIDLTTLLSRDGFKPPLQLQSLSYNGFKHSTSVDEHDDSSDPHSVETDHPDDLHTNDFRSDLFRLCAPSLQRLSWSVFRHEQFSYPVNFPTFENLKELRLAQVEFPDIAHLKRLMPRKSSWHLRTLAVCPDLNPSSTEFFTTKGTMISMKTFVWEVPDSAWGTPKNEAPFAGGMSFLRSNPQIHKFKLNSHSNDKFLIRQIIPLLSGSFQHLTSLSIASRRSTISVTSLQSLSNIVALQQLHISADMCNCGINHAAIRHYLKPLKRLKLCAFSEALDARSYCEVHRRRSNLIWTCCNHKGWVRGPSSSKETARVSHQEGRMNLSSRTQLSDSDFVTATVDDVGYSSSEDGDDRHMVSWEVKTGQLVWSNEQEYFRVFPSLELLFFGFSRCPRTVKNSRLDREQKACRSFLETTFGWPYEV